MLANTKGYKKEEMKLPKYFFILEITGLLGMVVVGGMAHFFPLNFYFLGGERLAYILFFLFLWHTACLVAQIRTGKKIFFAFTRYGWTAMFCSVVYISGGINSPVLYFLVVPLLVSTVDLDARDTKRVGYIIVLFLVSLFIFNRDILSFVNITKHLFSIFMFSIISYYMYLLVKESLQIRYEKEQAKAETARLIELDRIKGDFITIASHQLRTPLSGITWSMTELMNRFTNASPDDLALVRGSLSKSKLATDILTDLMQTVKLNSGELHVKKADCDMNQIIRDIIKDTEQLINEHKVIIEPNLNNDALVKADPMLVKIALDNIINNSIKYSPGGKVTIKTKKSLDDLSITIEDNGIGIPENDLPYVFERMYRGRSAIEKDPNQSGVGLYTSKQIIEMHGGKVDIESEENVGTRVIINLPIQ